MKDEEEEEKKSINSPCTERGSWHSTRSLRIPRTCSQDSKAKTRKGRKTSSYNVKERLVGLSNELIGFLNRLIILYIFISFLFYWEELKITIFTRKCFYYWEKLKITIFTRIFLLLLREAKDFYFHQDIFFYLDRSFYFLFFWEELKIIFTIFFFWEELKISIFTWSSSFHKLREAKDHHFYRFFFLFCRGDGKVVAMDGLRYERGCRYTKWWVGVEQNYSTIYRSSE